MSTYDEIESSINFINKFGSPVTLMQCTSKYPTRPQDWGLNVIQELKDLFNTPVGFSDHSGTIYPCLAAAGLGADIFEFHVVFDKNELGPDVSSSISISQVKTLTEGINSIRTGINNPIKKNDNSEYLEIRKIFGNPYL